MSYSIKNTKEFSGSLESLRLNKQQGGVLCVPRLTFKSLWGKPPLTKECFKKSKSEKVIVHYVLKSFSQKVMSLYAVKMLL